MSTLKKDDDKEIMADIASVILLLAVSEERQQQIMEAKEKIPCLGRSQLAASRRGLTSTH